MTATQPPAATWPEHDRSTPAGPLAHGRPRAAGRFLAAGDHKLYVRGVTYGPLCARHGAPDGLSQQVAERDLRAMRAIGIDALRVYEPPPVWFLDLAAQQGLYVLVGLPWEEHAAVLGDRRRMRSIEERIGSAVRERAGHPAVLAFAVGNEIPGGIVRWHGRRTVERAIARLYGAAKEQDPGALVTYVNYPTTEYLELPFLDLACWNVFLEAPGALAAYLPRLLNLAGDVPLLLTEIGLDSQRHGEAAQAEALERQSDVAFAAGAAGAFVFSWTDDWQRGGRPILDWGFGLTDRDRVPKPALASVRRAFARVPFRQDAPWPSVSVVICSYNGEATIGECLDGATRLDYPDYEVIVVDDGSTDATAAIAQAMGVRVVRQPNRGLSAARNTGLAVSRGEIVAYTDDDARPDPHWLRYLAATFLTTRHAAVGGPNVPPPRDGAIASCVANAPGGPLHVLTSDTVAEHIPGCNMAFRRADLAAMGGFDERFWVAGDDVDACWRLQDRGGTIGFSAGAMVWHHRRGSIHGYLRQQRGYGRAESMLESRWPERFNALGHVPWGGRIYGPGLLQPLASRPRVYAGTWGLAPFGRLYQPATGGLSSLLLTPEWYLVILALAVVGGLGLAWWPLMLMWAICLAAALASVLQAVRGGTQATFRQPLSRPEAMKRRLLVVALHLAQPAARLAGRLAHGLSPWRYRGLGRPALPRPWRSERWSERWQEPASWLEDLSRRLRAAGAVVLPGGPMDGWDLEVCGGLLGGARVLVAIEEHGAGQQLVRLRGWPLLPVSGLAVVATLGLLSVLALSDGGAVAAIALGAAAVLLAGRMSLETARACGLLRRAAAAW